MSLFLRGLRLPLLMSLSERQLTWKAGFSAASEDSYKSLIFFLKLRCLYKEISNGNDDDLKKLYVRMHVVSLAT